MTAAPLARREGTGFAIALALVFVAAGASASLGGSALSHWAGSPVSPGSRTNLPEGAMGEVGAQVLLPGGSGTVTAMVPTTGTPPYSWQWLYSTDSGQDYRAATPAQCAVPHGSGAPAGAEETCSVPASATTVPGTYHFELEVQDSATAPETILSAASTTVTVPSTGNSARPPQFDGDPQEDCTGGCDMTDWFGGTGGSGALAITTASTDELLVLEITDSGQFSGDLSTADISDTQGSTWTLEPVHDWNGFGHEQYLFYALDGTAGADTVTIDSTSTHTTTTTATAVLSAFSGVDTSAPIAAVGTFETGTGTQSSASVTASVAPTTILGIVSTTNGASAFTPTTNPAFTEAGTIDDGSASASYIEYYADTSTGTYTSQPTWTGSVHWGAMAIAVQGANPLSVSVSPTSVVLDQGQSVTVTATVAGGSGGPTYTWSVLSGSCPGFSNSGTASLTYTPSGTTTNCVLTVTVEDSAGDFAQPPTTASVTVNTGLGTPATPTPNAVALDVNQAETVSGSIPTTGTPTYAWSWLVSVDGGGYAATTQCATNGGSGATAGAAETCAIAANRLTAGDTYAFALKVTDSATTPESTTTTGSATVTVSSALVAPSAPTVSATLLDVDQALTAHGAVATTGTAPYAWAWMVSVDGAADVAATQCATNGGTGALAGATETCSVAAGSLTAGDTYSFELKVTDSATTAETATSSASPTVHVSSALVAPSAPTLSAAALDADQAETVTGTIPSAGTAPYSWQWLVSVDGAGYAAASECATDSGNGASAGAVVTCSVAADSLAPGDSYSFELKVTDGATAAETATSASSTTLSVASALTAPATPGTSATTLDLNQALTIHGTIPTTGTSTYSWEWLVSVNGAGYTPTTFCAVNSGSGATAGATETCAAAAGSLTVGSTYAFELQVTDGATAPETATSVASAAVHVNSVLTAPATPTLSAGALDVDQTEAVFGSIPSSGTGPYSWEWFVSVNGGAEIAASECAVGAGSGASAGAAETCSIAAGALTPGDRYTFTLEVTDSSGAGAELASSDPSPTVSVSPALSAPAAPTVSTSTLSLTEPLTVAGTLPSNGTPDYAWQWMVSTNGGAYAAASVCGSTASGTDAAAGATVRCAVPMGSLAPGAVYTFELEVTDSASLAEHATSPASSSVTVIGPAIAVGTSQGPVGAQYRVVGTGFTGSSTVTVSFGSVALTPLSCSDGSFSGTEITTDATGGFDCSFPVPSEAPGVYSVVGTDVASSASTVSFSFTVTAPELTVFPLEGQVGATVTINGTGFSVSTPLASLVFDAEAISSCLSGSLTTNGSGAFSCTFVVPGGASGSEVVATDAGGSAATARFTVLAGTASAASTAVGDWAWIVLAVAALAVLLVVLGVRRRRSARSAGPSAAPSDRPGPSPSGDALAPPTGAPPAPETAVKGGWATLAPEAPSSSADEVPFSLLAFAPAAETAASREPSAPSTPSVAVDTPSGSASEPALESSESPSAPIPESPTTTEPAEPAFVPGPEAGNSGTEAPALPSALDSAGSAVLEAEPLPEPVPPREEASPTQDTGVAGAPSETPTAAEGAMSWFFSQSSEGAVPMEPALPEPVSPESPQPASPPEVVPEVDRPLAPEERSPWAPESPLGAGAPSGPVTDRDGSPLLEESLGAEPSAGSVGSTDLFPASDSPPSEVPPGIAVPPIPVEFPPVAAEVTAIAILAPSLPAVLPQKDGKPMREIARVEAARSFPSTEPDGGSAP